MEIFNKVVNLMENKFSLFLGIWLFLFYFLIFNNKDCLLVEKL